MSITLPSITDSRFTHIGIESANFVDLADWKACGVKLLRWDGSWNWIKGDWWNLGHRFANTNASESRHLSDPLSPTEELALYRSIASLMPLDDTTRATLSTIGWICRRVPFSIRIETLTFSHHREVAPIESRSEQVRLLNLADKKRWTVMDLRQAIRPKPSEIQAPITNFVVQRWKNEFIREVIVKFDPKDFSTWPPERRRLTLDELRPIIKFCQILEATLLEPSSRRR